MERYELARTVGEHYRLVIAASETSRLAQSCSSITTAPFLIRDWAELPSRAQAARLLQLDEDQSAVLLVGSGTVEECREIQDLAQDLARQWGPELPSLRLACPQGDWNAWRSDAHLLTMERFPLMDVLPAVRLLIGGAGYNLVHESRATGVPGLFVPRERKYDDQFGRLQDGERLSGDVIAAVCRELAEGRSARSTIRRFSNWAVEVAEQIARLL